MMKMALYLVRIPTKTPNYNLAMRETSENF